MSVERCSYSIAGVRCTVSGDPELLRPIELTYAAFACPEDDGVESYRLFLRAAGDGAEVSDSEGLSQACPLDQAPIAALDMIVRRVVSELARDGVYAIHAASLSASGRALLISGRSGAGKSTLALGLLARGFRLLSDEFGLCAADGRSVLPYRRAVHVRPGTPELIAELEFLSGRPRLELGGGSEWSLSPEELAEVFPGCLGEPSELGFVLLLEPRGDGEAGAVEPVAAGLAAIELTRATPAAADDFTTVLARMSALAASARCGRLRPGTLASTLTAIEAWIATEDT